MVGRSLTAVALTDPGEALSTNYLKVSLATERTPRRLCEVRIGGITADGVREWSPLQLL